MARVDVGSCQLCDLCLHCGPFPKFIAGKRGFFVCAVISSAITPCYLLGSASIFVSFLASYQIFLSAITGVLLGNYYPIARGSLNMWDCLTASKSGCIITLEVGICEFLRLPEMGVSTPIGVTRFSNFAYWVRLFVFWVSCKISPPDIMYSSS
jgi:nucleobase:cation symporter-1, NCS1 family